MKKTTFLLALFAVFALKTFSQEAYKITGVFPTDSLDGCTVKLINVYLSDYVKPYVLDSTTMQNGTFSFTGSVNEPVLAGVIVNPEYPFRIASLILEQGEIGIAFIDSENYIVAGTPLNQEYYRDMVEPLQLFIEKDTMGERIFRDKLRDERTTWTEEDKAHMRYLRTSPMREIGDNRHKREKDFMVRNIHKYPKVVASLIMQRYLIRWKYTEQMEQEYADRIREYVNGQEEVMEKYLKKHPELQKQYAEMKKKQVELKAKHPHLFP